MSKKINILPQDLINVIAAGEVVERPASVVKELVENSVDAKSTFIRVNIKNYGKDLIEVIDNGSGMSKEDARLAFVQHATSKISSKQDLENIISFGFRGEALASISSVSETSELETKTANDDAVFISIASSKINEGNSTKADTGTRISINNLFKNVPARKKFLKSDNTEFRNIVNTFIDIALINIDIHFEIYHNDKLIHRLTKATSIKDRIFEIWGRSSSESFLEEKNVETNLTKIKLILEDPSKTKKNTSLQYIYVNNRRIDSKVIHSAVKEAYQGFIHRDLKPSFIVLLEMDPRIVDVNVHPRKLEVRFEDSQGVFRAVYSATKKTLENTTKQNIENTLERSREIGDEKTLPWESPSYKPQTFTKPYNTSSRVDNIASYDRKPSVNQAISFSKEIMDFKVEETQPEIVQKLSQLFNTYIVYEKDDYLVFIDQHAAAEKISFEKLVYQVGAVHTKPLLIPTVIELKSHQKEELLSNKENLADIGIIIEDFGGNEIQILEIPEIIENIDFEDYIHEILNNKDDFISMGNQYQDLQLSREIYNLLALTACHGSIRAGEKLSEEEMRSIISNLKTLKQPNNCPHGRPISWKLKKSEIEKNFKRIV